MFLLFFFVMLQTFAKKDWFCIVFHNVFGSPASNNFGFTLCFWVCVGSCLQKHNFVNVFFGFGWFLFSKHLFFDVFLVLLGGLSFKAMVFQCVFLFCGGLSFRNM